MIIHSSKKHKYHVALSREADPKQSGKRWLVVSVTAIFLVTAWLAVTFSGISTVSDMVEGSPLNTYDVSEVPQSVMDDASSLAKELYGNSQQMCDKFVRQLLATYVETRDKDFIIVFNPGGWGGSLASNSADWWSILTGMQSELDDSGYTSLTLNYQRTVNTLQARINELKEMLTGYSSKATELAYRVKFLTSHAPSLRVILAGESTGSLIADDVMKILRDDARVYSIQTGIPFWHKTQRLYRTLQINNNGAVPDSFSEGEIWTIIVATVRYWIDPSTKSDGTILNFLQAPGHDYWWQDPVVNTRITDFFKNNFGSK